MSHENSKNEETTIPTESNESSPEQTSEVNVDTLREEISHLKDQWLRAVAESENIRRRAQKDREDALKYAATNFARDLLSVRDNLRRALESCPQDDSLPDSIKALIEGVDMTERELLNVFERHGIKKIDPIHEKFDPNFHQAMFEIENSEVESGTILQVLQQGYTIHDRLLRPALVAVAKGAPEQLEKTDITA